EPVVVGDRVARDDAGELVRVRESERRRTGRKLAQEAKTVLGLRHQDAEGAVRAHELVAFLRALRDGDVVLALELSDDVLLDSVPAFDEQDLATHRCLMSGTMAGSGSDRAAPVWMPLVRDARARFLR